MGEDQSLRLRTLSDLGGLRCGQMAPGSGLLDLAVEEGGFADEEVHLARERIRSVADPCVHDKGHALAAPRRAHIAEVYRLVPHAQATLSLEASNLGTVQAQCCELVW